MHYCENVPSIVRLVFHVTCQVVFVPAGGRGASHPEYSEQVKIRGINYINLKFLLGVC